MRALATRIGKVPGWRVERAPGSEGYKVYAPDGSFVTGIHLTPSDVRSDDIVLRTCAASGFLEDEEKYLAREERDRRKRIEAEQQKAVLAAAKAQKVAQTRVALRARAAGPFVAIEEFEAKWLFGEHKVPDVRAGIMTPALAQKLLDGHNTENRPRKMASIRTVTRALQTERWLLTHEAVALSSDRFLLDGQNRLVSIVETGIPAPVFVFVGMDPRTKYVVGQQSVRTAADAFSMAGIPDPNNAAACVRTVTMFDKPFIAWHSFRMSNDEVIDAYRADPEGFARAVRDAANTIGQSRKIKRIRCSVSTMAAAIYLIRKGNTRRLVDEFLEGLRTGANLREGDPRSSLVDWFSWVAIGKHPTARYEPFAMLVLAWNGWVQGDQVRNLKWRNRHEFPVITTRR
jgi:hypothetical protein